MESRRAELYLQHACNPLHLWCRLRDAGDLLAFDKVRLYENKVQPYEVYQRLFRLLKSSEGLQLKPYRDTRGVLTIGYGINLEEGITEEEAEFLLASRVARATQDLLYVLPPPVLESLNGPRWAALVEMIYNLGAERFMSFRKMVTAIMSKDWAKAAKEALDSKWARQVGQRAHRISKMLETGQWPEKS